jgi:hypothetical protein
MATNLVPVPGLGVYAPCEVARLILLLRHGGSIALSHGLHDFTFRHSFVSQRRISKTANRTTGRD